MGAGLGVRRNRKFSGERGHHKAKNALSLVGRVRGEDGYDKRGRKRLGRNWTLIMREKRHPGSLLGDCVSCGCVVGAL